MKRKLKSPTISLDLCVYLGVEPSCLCMRWPVWERLKSGCICAQSLSPDFPGKNTGAGCHFLLRGIIPTKDQTYVSCVSSIGRWVLHHQAIWKAPYMVITGTFLRELEDRTVRETGLKAQRRKLAGSSCSLRCTSSQHLPSRTRSQLGTVSIQLPPASVHPCI